MMRTRKAPTRSCVGCGLAENKSLLIRLVRATDGHVEVDATGKVSGRGAYVCPRMECFDAAVARKRLDGALRAHLHDDDLDRLKRDLEDLLASRAPSQLGR